MSIALMTLVFYIDPDVCDTAEKMVLLSYADHADDEGKSIHPSNARTEWKCSMTTRGIQRISRRLEKKGLLKVVRQGGGRHKVNDYEIDMDNVIAISRNPRERFTETPTLSTETPTLKPQNPDPQSGDPSLTTNNHQKRHAKKARAAEEEPMPAELQYEACNEDGSPIVPKFGVRPKWSIPEKHPILDRAMKATRRKYWKDHAEKALWKPVRASIDGGLVSAEWIEWCLQFAEKKNEKKPIALGSLLLYMVNIDKMQDWLSKNGKALHVATGKVNNHPPTAVNTSSAAEIDELPEWDSPYDN